MPEAATPTMIDVPRERILVVDDEAGIRDLVGSYLRNEGFDVDEAADGEGALARFAEGAHDLIVLDLRLPGVGGPMNQSPIHERPP